MASFNKEDELLIKSLYGGAENAELDITEPDNAAPYSKGGQRETWKRGARSNRGVTEHSGAE